MGQDWPSEAAIHKGALCPDGQWRKKITIEDAAAGGCDLFDIDRLRLENDEDRFDQLYMCKFIDSTQSVFTLADLERCYSDQSLWADYDPDPKAERPFGNSPVWLGYDPSRTRDDATCVVVAPPLEPGARFRILEKHSWRGHSFTYQAAQVKKLCERFNVQHIGIDITGVGYGVFDLVPRLLPARHADSLQPRNQKHAGTQSTGHDSGQPHRMGRGLERHRRCFPHDQARGHGQRPDHLQRFTHRCHRPRRRGLGRDARAGTRTPKHQQAASQPLLDNRTGQPWQSKRSNIRRNHPSTCGPSRLGLRNRYWPATWASTWGVFASDDGRIYTPPVSRTGLARLLRANAHHGTIPRFKRNLLLRDYIPSAGCSAQTMGRAALDFMVFGEAYFQRLRNIIGQVLELRHLPAINMRRKVGGGFVMLLPNGQELHFAEDEVEHVMDYGTWNRMCTACPTTWAACIRCC